MAFGTSELSLRLPNVLAFLLYLTCAMLLLERIDGTLTRVAGFVLLAMNPFVLDFFALARGYGLAMAFLLASLYLLLRGSLRRCLAAGALAVLASLAFVNAFIPIAAVVLWLLVRQNRVREAWFAGAACAAFLLVIGLEVLRLADGGRLYFGGERGFIDDTLFSLVRATLYVPSSSEGVLAFVVIAAFFALAFRRTPMFVILCGAVLLTLVEHFVAGTRFPLERVALYYIPLFALALIFAMRGKSAIAISAVIVCLGVWHFARTFDVHTNRTWPYDAHNNELLEQIDRDRGGRNVRAGVSWQLEPSLNFYRITRNYTWLAPLTRHAIDGTEDYVYAFAPDVPRGRWLVLARYPDTGTIFVKSKRARVYAILSPLKTTSEVLMVLFNHATREMTAKIVYYGPGLCGKTTNLMVIFDKLDPKQKGKMLSLATKTDRTLFFDLLPVDIGKVGNFNLKIQLYTVPGQVFYNETRKLVLKGADSVVFVADSQPSMVESNRESFANLMENLEQNQIDPNDTPIVIQFNKRDIPGVLPVEELQEQLGFEGYPYSEASALKGEGVMETFKLVSKITAKHLMNRLKGKSNEPIDRKKSLKTTPVAAPAPKAPEPEPEPEPVPMPPTNPFEDSLPFPESTSMDQGYEAMEEVSLEQLVSEGRERPMTMSGNIAVPIIDEVEELGAESLMPAEEPVAVAVMDEPEIAPIVASDDGRVGELEAEVARLHAQLASAQDRHRVELEKILSDLDDLSSRLRMQLGA